MVHTHSALNAQAGLADFLTGNSMPKPDLKYGMALPRVFSDLQRRAVLLDQVAANSCRRISTIPILQAPVPLNDASSLNSLSVFSPPFVH